MIQPEMEIDIGTLLSTTGWRAEVGMLAPIPGLYREWDIVAPDGVRFSSTILGVTKVTVEDTLRMTENIDVEAKKLTGWCDLICLGCTGSTFVGGHGFDQKLIEKIEKASGIPATTTTTCVLELFKDMNIKNIALVGPYPPPMFDAEVEYFKAYGIESLCVKGLGLDTTFKNRKYSRDLFGIYRLVKEGDKAAPDADCVFVTCMESSILGIVDALEEELGKPVISSPSATLYGILKKLGIPDPVYHYGQALRRARC